MNIKPIKWTDEQQPNDECAYTHVKGTSPLGDFLITWKGWKEWPSYDVEGSPWGWLDSGSDLQDAKNIAKKEYESRILDCLDLAT